MDADTFSDSGLYIKKSIPRSRLVQGFQWKITSLIYSELSFIRRH